MADDFTLPDGRLVSANLNNFESTHRDFAIHCKFNVNGYDDMISNLNPCMRRMFHIFCSYFLLLGMLADREKPGVGAALFTREFGRTASYYSNATFLPNFYREPRDFLPPNRTEDIERASELCGESYQCRYDYGMSLNRDMAHYTKFYYDKIVNIKTINDHRVMSCGVLETPRFGRKSTFEFTPGTNVAFECDQGFMLIGDPRRSCKSDGRWDPPVYGYTQCLRKSNLFVSNLIEIRN